MGSKNKIAGEIVDFILKENPDVKYFYDLFGGGGAMSFEAIQRPQIKKVYYNELNTGVVELLKDIQKNGVTEKYYNWISREDFHKNVKNNDWFGGLVKTIWSFGNCQNGYLYGKQIEDDKKLLHEIIVDKNISSLKEFNNKFNTNVKMNLQPDKTLFEVGENIKERRLRILREVKKDNKLEHLEQLQHLERLQQLERLEYFEQLKHLKISNKSYNKIIIDTPAQETIIYLDPPYANTGKYQKKLNYDELNKYIKKSRYKIYVSSYDFPLNCVLEIKHRTTMSQKFNSATIEKLYYNKS